MTHSDLIGEAHELDFHASMNQSYHQKQWAWYGFWERSVRISITVLACVSLGYSLAAGPWVPSQVSASNYVSVPAIIVSALSLVAAIVLNVAPLDRRERAHESAFRRWNDLMRDARDFRLRAEAVDKSDTSALQMLVAELQVMRRRLSEIEVDEPPYVNNKLLDRCQEDENQRRWGVRSNEEAEQKRDQQRTARSMASAGV